MQKSDDKKYTRKSKLTATELKQFRSKVAALKKAGKLPPKTDPKIAQPYFVRGGKTLAELVNKAAEPPKPPRQKLAPLGKALSVHDFPLKHKSLARVLQDIEDNPAAINALKKPDESWGFEVNGIRSLHIYEDIGKMAKDLGESAGIQKLLHKHQESQEFYKSLKIVRWNKTTDVWKPRKQHRKPSHTVRQAKSRATKKAAKKGKKK